MIPFMETFLLFILVLSARTQTCGQRLRVSVGPNISHTTQVLVNNDLNPFYFESDHFMGRIILRFKNAADSYVHSQIDPESVLETENYFKNHNAVFSFQIEGIFKSEFTAQDVWFGSQMSSRLDRLPWGTRIMSRFAKSLDPGLEIDLNSDQPSSLSPLVCAMNVMNVRPTTYTMAEDLISNINQYDEASPPESGSSSSSWSSESSSSSSSLSSEDDYTTEKGSNSDSESDDSFDSFTETESQEETESDLDYILEMPPNLQQGHGVDPGIRQHFGAHEFFGNNYIPEKNLVLSQFIKLDSHERKRYFLSRQNREEYKFIPGVIYSFDFYNANLDFAHLKLRIPFFERKLTDFWSQGTTSYVAKTKDSSITFFAINFELNDEESEASSSDRDDPGPSNIDRET